MIISENNDLLTPDIKFQFSFSRPQILSLRPMTNITDLLPDVKMLIFDLMLTNNKATMTASSVLMMVHAGKCLSTLEHKYFLSLVDHHLLINQGSIFLLLITIPSFQWNMHCCQIMEHLTYVPKEVKKERTKLDRLRTALFGYNCVIFVSLLVFIYSILLFNVKINYY